MLATQFNGVSMAVEQTVRIDIGARSHCQLRDRIIVPTGRVITVSCWSFAGYP